MAVGPFEEDGLAHLEDVYSSANRQTRAGIAKVISRSLPALATTQSSFLQKQHGERVSLRVHVVGEEDAIKERVEGGQVKEECMHAFSQHAFRQMS